MITEPTPPSGISSSLWSHRVFQQLFWAHALSLFGSGLSSLALGLLAHQLVGASAAMVLGITLAIRIIVIGLRLTAVLTHHPPDILRFAEKHENIVSFEAAVGLWNAQHLLDRLMAG